MKGPGLTVGAVEFVAVSCYVIIFSVIWRGVSARLANYPIGQAMAAVYS